MARVVREIDRGARKEGEGQGTALVKAGRNAYGGREPGTTRVEVASEAEGLHVRPVQRPGPHAACRPGSPVQGTQARQALCMTAGGSKGWGGSRVISKNWKESF